MPQLRKRPQGLPDFVKPPLNEVVLGVQFAPQLGYQQIHAYKVWELFKAHYPRVEEYNPLPPSFETFGLPSGNPFAFNMVTGPMHDRFWFVSPEGDELLQFQHDRLLHNWRKVGDQTNEYPRFEKMVRGFSGELRGLNKFFVSLTKQSMACNQAEVSYINHIPLHSDAKISDWVRFADFAVEPEDATIVFRERIRDKNGQPVGRLICECGTGVSPTGQRILNVTLTARGMPPTSNIDGAIAFLKIGRMLIVKKFAAITTEKAQKLWGRVQ